MNLHCSLAQAVESSEGSSLGGEPSVPSRSTSIANGFLCSGRMTESLSRSRFGRTSEHSTGNPGLDAWISSQAGSRARTSVRPEKAQESTGNDQDFGWKWPGSFAKYDPATSSWKTRQCSVLGGLEEFSETWPKWGSMRDGECLALAPLVRYVRASESGLSLLRPTATCWKAWTFLNISSLIRKGHADGNIQEQFARLFRRMITPESNEILMLWPQGWSDLKPLETVRFQRWLEQHGEY